METKIVMTAEELFELGDVSLCELVKGELIRVSPAGREHGKIALTIGRLLGNYVGAHRLGEVCAAETGFLIARDPDTVRAPDAAFVDKDRVPPEGESESYWPFAPDLAVEVISRNDRWIEIEEKVEGWLRAGTWIVWVINPRTHTIHVYHPTKEVFLLSDQDILSGEDVLPGFSVTVSEVFE